MAGAFGNGPSSANMEGGSGNDSSKGGSGNDSSSKMERVSGNSPRSASQPLESKVPLTVRSTCCHCKQADRGSSTVTSHSRSLFTPQGHLVEVIVQQSNLIADGSGTRLPGSCSLSLRSRNSQGHTELVLATTYV